MMLKYLIPFFVLFITFQLAFVPVHAQVKKKPRLINITDENDETDVSVEIDFSKVNYEDVLGTHYLFEIISKVFDTFIQKWNSDKPKYLRGRETVEELWFSVERIFKDPIGSKTIQILANKITEILTDPRAHDTLLKIIDTSYEILIKGGGLQNITKIMQHVQSNKQLQTTVSELTNLFFNENSQINSVPQMKYSFGALKSWIRREIILNAGALLNEKQSKPSSNTVNKPPVESSNSSSNSDNQPPKAESIALENTATNELTKSKSNLSQLTSSNLNSVDQPAIPNQSSVLKQQTSFKPTFRPFQQLSSSIPVTNDSPMRRFGSFGNSGGFNFLKPDSTTL